AAANDQVLLAVHHVQVAVGVQAADVAGVQPATEQGRRSLRGRIPVAGHDAVGADADLPVGPHWYVGVVGVADRNLVAGDGPREPGRLAPGGFTEITAPDSVQP